MTPRCSRNEIYILSCARSTVNRTRNGPPYKILDTETFEFSCHAKSDRYRLGVEAHR